MPLTALQRYLYGALIAGILLSAAPAAAMKLSPGDTVPNFCLSDIYGTKVSLDQFRGKVVVIAFWSIWCSRCEEELAFLRDNYGKREDVAVLLVNQESGRDAQLGRVRSLAEKLGINFPILLDEGLVLWNDFGIEALPASVVIDRDGRVVTAAVERI